MIRNGVEDVLVEWCDAVSCWLSISTNAWLRCFTRTLQDWKKTMRTRLGTYPIWLICTKVPCSDGKINLFAIEYALTHRSKALYTKFGLSIGNITSTFINYLPQPRILLQKVRFIYFPLNGLEDFFLYIMIIVGFSKNILYLHHQLDTMMPKCMIYIQ